MHQWMQGLDAPIHHLGKAGDLAHVTDRQAGVANGLGGAAGGDQFDAVRDQDAREFKQSGFVGHGKQRAAHCHGFGRGH